MTSATGSRPQIPGVADDIIEERGYRWVTSWLQLSAHENRFLEKQQRTPGLLVPAYRLGAPEYYACALRPESPRINHQTGKTIKYEWPYGVRLCLDVLPRYRQALTDPDVPIVFTEGAKKADALASVYGDTIVPINISGVDGWHYRDHSNASQPLDDFKAIVWLGRDVRLCFDSDVVTKPEVHRALKALARYVGSLGAAQVRWVDLTGLGV